jgi:hypothetical protein
MIGKTGIGYSGVMTRRAKRQSFKDGKGIHTLPGQSAIEDKEGPKRKYFS